MIPSRLYSKEPHHARSADATSGSLLSYIDLEARIPARHPLRVIREIVNGALASLDADFEALYDARPARRDGRGRF